MPRSAKALFALCILLTLVAVGHDIYIWQTSNGFPFAFAALGWITRTYVPDIQQMIVDAIGVDMFNTILTPILKIPAAFLAAGCAVMIYIGAKIYNKMGLAHTRDKWSSRKFQKRT